MKEPKKKIAQQTKNPTPAIRRSRPAHNTSQKPNAGNMTIPRRRDMVRCLAAMGLNSTLQSLAEASNPSLILHVPSSLWTASSKGYPLSKTTVIWAEITVQHICMPFMPRHPFQQRLPIKVSPWCPAIGQRAVR
jgi:hypothetical protein